MYNKSVLFDARMISSSGIGSYIKEIIRQLNGKVSLTCISTLETQDHCSQISQNDNLTLKVYPVKEQIELTRMPACDIFLSPHFNIPLLPLKTKKRVVTIQDIYSLTAKRKTTLIQRLYMRAMLNAAVRLSDAVITVSEFAKNRIVKYTGCSPAKIKVIHNGIKQKALISYPEVVQWKYDLPDHYILYVDDFKCAVDFDKVLRAYSQLVPKLRSRYKLVIAVKEGMVSEGEILLCQKYVDMAKQVPGVCVAGFIDGTDMDTVYAKASMLIYTSYYQGLNLPPLEAMLNNCPVIASNAAGLPEICGNAAEYFDPVNEDNISFKITELLIFPSLRKALIEIGAQHVKKFTWESCVEQHMELFDTLQQNTLVS